MPLNETTKQYLRMRLEVAMEAAPDQIEMSAIILRYPNGAFTDTVFTVGGMGMEYTISETLINILRDLSTPGAITREDLRNPQ